MVRDLDNERKKIRNGNRYIQESEGYGVFSRDVDRLFIEYTNLRNKLYNKYRVNFRDEPSRNDLQSYIDEQFIKLVKEYDVNSPVDFPGYVKRKLYARVYGYVKRNQRDNYREGIPKDEGILEETTEDLGVDITETTDMVDLLSFIFKGVTLEEYEKDIVDYWLHGKSNTDIKELVARDYEDISQTVAQKHIDNLKDLVLLRIEEYNQ